MIIVMPNTSACASYEPSAPGKDDACTQEYLKDIIPYVDSHYRTKASREYRALAGLIHGRFRRAAHRIAAPGYVQRALRLQFGSHQRGQI